MRVAVLSYGQIVESVGAPGAAPDRSIGATSGQHVFAQRGESSLPAPSTPATAAALDLRTTLGAPKLEHHLEWYAQHGFQTITLEELAGLDPDPSQSQSKRVALTFDGGYASHHAAVLPLLEKRRQRATFLIPREMIDRPGGLSRRAIESLAKQGMSVGVLAPPAGDLLRMLPPALATEVAEPRRALEEAIGRKVTVCATHMRHVEEPLMPPLLRTLHAHDFRIVAGSEVGNHVARDGVFVVSRYLYRKSVNPDDWKSVARCAAAGPAKAFFQVRPQ